MESEVWSDPKIYELLDRELLLVYMSISRKLQDY